MKNFMKQLIRSFQYSLYPDDSMKVDWVKQKNFGDILNPVLIELLTGKKPNHIVSKYFNDGVYYSVIGSILGRAKKNTIVWGSGYISSEDKVIDKPKKICAVRGPKTRERLIEQGYECPEVYGDPALLMPLLYKPVITKKYKLGIIPHYVDKSNNWLNDIDSDGVKVLDIHTNQPLDFINQMLECERIASSSLHGLIISDAYEIPSVWIEFSDKVTGHGFKFVDYFLSVGQEKLDSIKIQEGLTCQMLIDACEYKGVNLDLKKLIKSAPFEVSLNINEL